MKDFVFIDYKPESFFKKPPLSDKEQQQLNRIYEQAKAIALAIPLTNTNPRGQNESHLLAVRPQNVF